MIQRIEKQNEQSTLFSRGLLACGLERVEDGPEFAEQLSILRHDALLLRNLPSIGVDVVDRVDELLYTVAHLSERCDVSETDQAEATSLGIAAGAAVCRFQGVDKQHRGFLYVNLLELLDNLTTLTDATSEQLAVSAANIGSIFGGRNDLRVAYGYLDLFIHEHLNSLQANGGQLPDGEVGSIRLRRALIDLAGVDKSDEPVARVHHAHVEQDRIAQEHIGASLHLGRSTLELLKIIYFIERRRPLTSRVIKFVTQTCGINPDDMIVEGCDLKSHDAPLIELVRKEVGLVA